MDGLEPRQNLVVIAATNRPEAIDEALRRPGRFDREIVVGVPDEKGRREILGIHTRGMPLDPDVNLDELARQTYGFVGADLAALDPRSGARGRSPDHAQAQPRRGHDPDRGARRTVGRAERFHQCAEARAALGDARGDGRNAVDRLGRCRRPRRGARPAARRRRASAQASGSVPPARHPAGRGFLLYGPPGTGKTLLAKATARESEANFIATKSSDLLSKWYGESEQQIARLFARARQVAPTIIFIDELDSLVPARGGGLGEPQVTERVVNTILAEMDGLEELNNVVLIGATNRPNLIDPALLRPGRLDELIYVGTPDTAGRRRILAIHTEDMPLADDVDLESLAQRTERFTGADLEDLVRRAGLTALRRGLDAKEGDDGRLRSRA